MGRSALPCQSLHIDYFFCSFIFVFLVRRPKKTTDVDVIGVGMDFFLSIKQIIKSKRQVTKLAFAK